MHREFHRVAIVNRSEAAVRFINAVRELNHENGTEIRTIALYTTPDRFSMFVREADEAHPLGPATFVDGAGARKVSYLDYGRLEEALRATRSDAAWVGWGFVAEHPEFVELCARLGVVFLGPGADAMRQLGDKITAMRLAEQGRVPVLPWSGGPVETLEGARVHAERIGYPLLVKATAGEGGRGIRRVDAPAELPAALESARAEAKSAFGSTVVYLERLLAGARHVEVQILSDHTGRTWAVGVRECTAQRRHQKVLEEAPSPALNAQLDREVRDAAVRMAGVAAYRGAGTVEFLFDPRSERFYFLEVNTRLGVEHPVTELTTGLDLVKMQIRLAQGMELRGEPPPTRGHAIEVRLCAEDPDNDFAPASGTFALLRLPTGPGIRIDRGVTEGDRMAPEFDSMIAKIIGHGRDRKEALARLHRALAESAVILEGGTSNKAFLLELLADPEVRSGDLHTGWLEGRMRERAGHARAHADMAMLQAAVEVYEEELRVEQQEFYASAARMRAQVRKEVGRRVELRYRGAAYQLQVAKRSEREYRIEVEGRRIDVEVERLGRFGRWLTVAGQRYRVLAVAQGPQQVIEVNGAVHRFSRDDGGIVRAVSPAVVISLAVRPGDEVLAGATLAVLEAMKMETVVTSPVAGRVREVFAISGTQVGPGTPLVQLDLLEPAIEKPARERVSFSALEPEVLDPDVTARCRRTLRELRQLILGNDFTEQDAGGIAHDYRALCAGGTPSAERIEAENDVLAIFIDVAALFRPRTEEGADYLEALGTTEYMLSYLRSLDSKASDIPASFFERLRRALAHYGITSLDRSPQLEEALLWVFKAHERPRQIPALVEILEQRLRDPNPPPEASAPQVREILDRIVTIGENRHPALADLARDVRFRYFDQPIFDERRQAVYRQVQESLAFLARDPSAPDRAERIEAMVACPQPLEELFERRFRESGHGLRQLMLEVLVRRHYRLRDLGAFGARTIADQSLAEAEYDHQGKRIRVIATHAGYDDLASAAEAIGEAVAGSAADQDVAVDLYVWKNRPLGSADESEAYLRRVLNAVRFERPLRRIVVGLSGPGLGWGTAGVQHFTFRPSDGGYVEERVYRGLHPMMGKRLQVWRLSRFHIERLPSAEDVYLFRAVARENAKDERLFAFAEVRELAPIRDAEGSLVGLPYLERQISEAFAAIRLFQARRDPHERLFWNRVILNVWPPLDLTADELQRMVRKLQPGAIGLGLEKVSVRCLIPHPQTGKLRDTILTISNPGATGVLVSSASPADEPIRPLSEYAQKVVRMRQRGLTYPYEIVSMLTASQVGSRGDLPPGRFQEYDLDDENRLVAVDRSFGRNQANVVVGVIRNVTGRYPEGMQRVILLGDPGREMGSLAEPECRRIMAALALARELRVPVEWFALSAGAKISMQSGTENMDWISKVLRDIVHFTQDGGELNVVVTGINVGAQPYWNAEATMLMHTRGILIMTASGAMVLTGKTALDYSGSVSAEDNFGIGGFDRIMGPNGQAQYFARDVHEACRILMRHYDHTYVAPTERFPRKTPTGDPIERDVCQFRHGGHFEVVGEIFSDHHNPGRKKPFDIRRVMLAAVDQDHPPLERWQAWRDAEIAVVWDAHLGGRPVCLIGFQSKPLRRVGLIPIDGPDSWTSGTLFPMASKKIARGINAASGNRPVVILANLSGFDGSPESMRKMQLEFGAEIGRAIVNFRGPVVFCVVSRYHGGAFVVFSKVLNDNMEAVALEGTYASVIGGAPAAAVVFAREVRSRTLKDARVVAMRAEIDAAGEEDRRRLLGKLAGITKEVHAEKISEMADEFDAVHSVHRALEVGSLDRIIPPARLRPYLVDAVERGVQRELKRVKKGESSNP